MDGLKGGLSVGILFLVVLGFFILADYTSTTPEQREERQYDRPTITEREAIEAATLKAFNDDMLHSYDFEGWTAQYIGNGHWIVTHRLGQWEVREVHGTAPTATFLGRK